MIRVGIRDRFGRSGNALSLLKLYGVSKEAIVDAALQVIQHKK